MGLVDYESHGAFEGFILMVNDYSVIDQAYENGNTNLHKLRVSSRFESCLVLKCAMSFTLKSSECS